MALSCCTSAATLLFLVSSSLGGLFLLGGWDSVLDDDYYFSSSSDSLFSSSLMSQTDEERIDVAARYGDDDAGKKKKRKYEEQDQMASPPPAAAAVAAQQQIQASASKAYLEFRTQFSREAVKKTVNAWFSVNTNTTPATSIQWLDIASGHGAVLEALAHHLALAKKKETTSNDDDVKFNSLPPVKMLNTDIAEALLNHLEKNLLLPSVRQEATRKPSDAPSDSPSTLPILEQDSPTNTVFHPALFPHDRIPEATCRVMSGEELTTTDGAAVEQAEKESTTQNLLAPASFDVATCAIGTMFFPHWEKGIEQQYHVLKKKTDEATGAIAMQLMWVQIPVYDVALDIAIDLGLVPPDTPRVAEAETVMKLRDPVVVREAMLGAGYRRVETEILTHPMQFTGEEASFVVASSCKKSLQEMPREQVFDWLSNRSQVYEEEEEEATSSISAESKERKTTKKSCSPSSPIYHYDKKTNAFFGEGKALLCIGYV